MVLTNYIVQIGSEYYRENPDSGVIEAITGSLAQELIDAGATVVSELTPAFTILIEGLGSALIKALQSGYTYARNQIRGKEDEAVTAIVLTAITVGSVVYVFRTMRRMKMSERRYMEKARDIIDDLEFYLEEYPIRSGYAMRTFERKLVEVMNMLYYEYELGRPGEMNE
jgi:hypothetical protein